MSLLDDLEAVMWWSGDGAINPTFEAYERLRTLLSHPGARVWLAALPGLLAEMKRTEETCRAPDTKPLEYLRVMDALEISLLDALHAAAETQKGNGE